MKPKLIPCSGQFLILFFILSVNNGFSQTTLDWSSSFSSAGADGATTRTANNITPGNNCTVTITNSQAGTYQNINGSIATPSVNTNNSRVNFFIIAGSTDCMEIDVDWTNDNAYVDVVYTFTKPVYNLVFRIGDIDKASAASNTYYDRVTITGLNDATPVLPTSITEVNVVVPVDVLWSVLFIQIINWQDHMILHTPMPQPGEVSVITDLKSSIKAGAIRIAML